MNSLLNAMIYSVRIRQFWVAFIELFRTVNIAQAKQIEMRIFGATNAVVAIQAGQDQEGQDLRGNMNIDDNPANRNDIPQLEIENNIAQQLNRQQLKLWLDFRECNYRVPGHFYISLKKVDTCKDK